MFHLAHSPMASLIGLAVRLPPIFCSSRYRIHLSAMPISPLPSKFPHSPPLINYKRYGCRAPPPIFSSHLASPTIYTAPAPPPVEAELPPAPLFLIRRLILCTLVWVTAFIASHLACGASVAVAAADDSIRASGFGLKVATALRRSGWADEAIVFTLATLPVLELRGAIPVGYWMHLDPLLLTVLSVIGNMVPVPFIVLYLKRLASFLSHKSSSATQFLDLLFERAREKAGPVEEFQWLGLMLFVAVPFPGTGAWTGAIIASILDMPFWSAVTANFFGVVLAGLLVNLLVSLGLKYAIVTGVLLFFVSSVMWSVLRHFKSR